MGIENDKTRRDFYESVANSLDEEDIKHLFTRLRKWEERHIERFSEINESLARDKTAESYEGEFNEYVRLLVDDKLYKNIEAMEFAEKVKSPIDAIKYGIGFAKDDILFFDILMSHVPETRRPVIKELMDEENQHLVYLHKLKGKYQN